MILWVMFAGIATMMAWGGEGETMTGFFLVLLVSGAFAALLRHVYDREHVPTFTALLVFIAAYCPRAWGALEQGFAFPLFASENSVAFALLQLITFLTIATFIGKWVASFLTRPAAVVEHIVTANRPGIGIIAVAIAVSLSTIAAFRTGWWSHYGSAEELESGGIRLELFYFPSLFAFSSAMGRIALKEAISEKSRVHTALFKVALWLATLTLLFIAQSRRMMLGALILAVASAWLDSEKISAFRATVMGIGLAFLGGVLLIGSYLWRIEGRTTDAVEHLNTISNRSVDLDAASKNFSERLTYLWIDSTSIENFDALKGRFDLWDAFSTTVINATPGIIMPDKYLYTKVVCELNYESLGLITDLPCTPTTEGLIYGGIPGIIITGIAFGCSLGIVTALYRRRTFPSAFFAGLALTQGLLIECSAFSVIDTLRQLIIVGSLTAIFAWTLRLLNRARSSSTSIQIRQEQNRRVALRHIRHPAVTNLQKQ